VGGSSQVSSTGVAIFQIFGHAARDDVVERGWDLGPVLARARDRRGQVRSD
jgi:hypothetical protein